MLAPYIPVTNAADRRVLIHDNYSARTSPVIDEAVQNMARCVVCRPPYRPHNGLFEFAINQATKTLEAKWSEFKDLDGTARVLNEIIDNETEGIDDIFVKCDYVHN